MKIAVLGLLIFSSVSNANILPAEKAITSIGQLISKAPEAVPALNNLLKSMGFVDAMTAGGKLKVTLTPAEEAKVLKDLKVSDELRIKYPEVFIVAANSSTTAVTNKIAYTTSKTAPVAAPKYTTSTTSGSDFAQFKDFNSKMGAAKAAHPEYAANIDRITKNVATIYSDTGIMFMPAQNCIVEGKVGAKSIQNIDTMIANVKYELVKSKPIALKAANKSACNEKLASYKYFLEVRDTLNFVNVTDTYAAMEYLCRVCKTCPVNAPTYVSNITDFSQISFTCSN